MNRNIPNVTSLVIQRETHSNIRQNGLANRDLLGCAEEKAASCEMEEISCQLPENTRSTFLVTFSPDGTKVASAHGNHKIYVSDVRTGKCLHTLEGHPRTPWCIAFHPSYNDILASGCLGGEVRVWDLHGGCEIWAGERNCVIASLTFHPSDQVLVIATTNMIYFWNWSQSQPFARCKTASEKERVRFVRFGPYGHKLFTGIANVSLIMREPDENSLNERLFILNDQHQQLLQRLQELQSRATGTREEQLLAMTSSGSAEQPRSSAIAEALRMAREYAGDISQTAQQPQRNSMQAPFGSYPVDEERSRRHSASRPDTQTNDVRDHQLLRNQNTTRLSFRDLQQNLRSMRIRYTRICERLQQLLQIRRWSSINSLNESVSDVNLVYSLLTFWREYETLAISLQHSTLHGYDANRESDSDARRHIAVAMVSLLQLQDMLHTSILQQINDVSDRGMARLIHSILMTLHELATLDTNILALRTTALEAIGMHAQWTSSIQRPEARRQRGPISSMSSSSENPSLTGASFLNSMSRPSNNISSSTTHQLASFRQIPHSDTLGNNGQNSGMESAFSQPERSSTSARNPVGSSTYFRDVASRTNSSNITPNLSLHNRVGERFCATSGGSASTSNGHSQDSNSNVRHENTGLRFGGMRNSRFAEPSSFQEPQSNMSNTERLLGSILEELLNLLVPANSNLNASTSSDVQNNSSSPFTANFSNTGHPSRMSPVSWYSYWWNHFPNIRSASGLHSGLMEPNLATRATYRIQYWDFTRFQIPDISSAQINIVVPECLIQNDANIEISADGRLLATLVPSNIATSTLLAVHSLQPDTFGQCLYLWSFSSSVISISLSPLGRYVLVGLGSNRRSSANHGDKLIIGQVLQMVEGKEDKNELQHVRTVELRGENRFDVSLNSMKWLPLPGQGLVYGTNRGDLRICRPRSCTDVWVKPKIQQSVAGPLRMYRDILARVLARRSGSNHSNPVTRLVFPTMNTTGTQTESDSDSG